MAPDFVMVRIPKQLMVHVEETRVQLAKLDPLWSELSQTTVVRLALEHGLKKLLQEHKAAKKKPKK